MLSKRESPSQGTSEPGAAAAGLCVKEQRALRLLKQVGGWKVKAPVKAWDKVYAHARCAGHCGAEWLVRGQPDPGLPNPSSLVSWSDVGNT